MTDDATLGHKLAVPEARDLVWDRPAPLKAPWSLEPPHARTHRVRAAVSLADKQGLEGVSLRKVAARLNVGPMRIYVATSTK